jgi:hypothetical protein
MEIEDVLGRRKRGFRDFRLSLRTALILKQQGAHLIDGADITILIDY